MQCVFYCRSGYESDVTLELETKLAEKGLYGFAKYSKNQGYIHYTLLNVPKSNFVNALEVLKQLPSWQGLVFARQKLIEVSCIELSKEDRISPILKALRDSDFSLCGDLFIEYPDTESGKQIAKFCKKFTVVMRQALRKHRILSKQPNPSLPYIHILFETSERCSICVSASGDRSEYPLGIKRLKMPQNAPSRSVLKLEEAMNSFFTKSQQEALFKTSMLSVDLGACPGGWTYQLVQHGLNVEAVDHGLIDDNLMQTGKVKHFSEDGFKYRPVHGHVDWLVCDMIEQPTRVSQLILQWMMSGWANASIFNLKLPMSKRAKVVFPILDDIKSKLLGKYPDAIIKAKHLYHNRDEVTVLIIVNSQMLNDFKTLEHNTKSEY